MGCMWELDSLRPLFHGLYVGVGWFEAFIHGLYMGVGQFEAFVPWVVHGSWMPV